MVDLTKFVKQHRTGQKRVVTKKIQQQPIVLRNIDKTICKDCELQEECKFTFKHKGKVLYYPKTNTCVTHGGV